MVTGTQDPATDLAVIWRHSLIHKIGATFVVAAYVCLIVASFSWFASPSQTMSQILDPAWTGVWSFTLAFCGIAALISRLFRWHIAEGTFSALAGVMIWCWSLIVLRLGYTVQPEVLQAGWALMCLAGLAVGWGALEIAWVWMEARYSARLLQELTRQVQARLDEKG